MSIQTKAIEKTEKPQSAPSHAPSLPRTVLGPTSIPQAAGNLATQRWLRSGAIQAKLTVNSPGDIYEQEADRVAERAVSSAPEAVARKCACGGTMGPDGECAACKANRMAFQRQATELTAPDTLPSSVARAIQPNSGQPLDRTTRAQMEPAFGADFSGVRVHTNPQADRAASDINAKAFTIGRNIYFRAGQFRPGTSAGDKLLAHELTHTIQQGSGIGARQAVGVISQPDEPQEQEAEAVAARVIAKTPVSQPTTSVRPGMLQRQDAAAAPVTAAQLIDKYTSWWNLDEEGLGKALASALPSQSILASEVLNNLGSSDRDDVAYEIASAASGKLSTVPDWLRIRLVDELVNGIGIVTDEEEGAIADIWKSFEPGLADVAEKNRELWKKSLWESDQLVAYVKPISDAFAADVIGLATAYLAENKRTLYAEAQRYGIDLENKQTAQPTHPDYLESVKPVAKGVLILKKQLDELKQINVGYHRIPDCLAGDCRWPSRFNPEFKPEMEPDKTESPAWPTWEEVKVQYDRMSAVISAFANMYPTIYLLIQQDNLEALDEAADAAEAQTVIFETMQKTEAKIQEANDKIDSGKITYYDLKLIQTQLFSGSGIEVYVPQYPWQQLYHQDIANDNIKGHEAREFWTDLGLSAAAAAALIAAPFTGGATAAFLVGFGVGIGAGQAGMSWEKYLSLSTLSDAKTKDELSLVAQGEVSAQLVDAIIQTAAVFLDVFGARAATTASRASRAALETAEKGVKEQLAEEASKRMLRGAGKEAAITTAAIGAAIAMHELADDEPVPDMQAEARQWQINLGADGPDTVPAEVSRMLIQRMPGPGSPATGAVAKQPILLTGGEFEVYVEKALLKGQIKGLPEMDFVIPGQYTGSGWGIDRIGIVVDESTGTIDVFHLEMKFVGKESGHVPKLGRPRAGTQTGRAWTQKAVDGFLTSRHRKARAGRERLRRAMKKMHPGEAIDTERMRSFLHGKLIGAPVSVIVPHWADFSKLYKQVAALVRVGREARIIKVFGK